MKCVNIVLDSENSRFVVTMRSWMSLILPKCSVGVEIVKDLKLDLDQNEHLSCEAESNLNREGLNSDSSDSEQVDDGDSMIEEKPARMQPTTNDESDWPDSSEIFLMPDICDTNEGIDECTRDSAYNTEQSQSPVRSKREIGAKRPCAEALLKPIAAQEIKRKEPLIHEFNCDKCSFSGKRRRNLREHTIALHTTEKPFKCTVCSYTAKLRRYIRVHEQRVHKIPAKKHLLVQLQTIYCDKCSFS